MTTAPTNTNRVCSIIEGEKRVSINSKETFTYGQNEFMLLPPESIVDMEIPKSTRALVLELSDHLIEHISKQICSELEIQDNFINNGTIFRDNVSLIGNDLREITVTAMGNARGKEFIVDLHAQKLVCTLLHNMGTKEILLRHHKNPIVTAIEIMKKQYTGGITVAEVAHAVGMSASLFSINFKKITGMTPVQYFTNIKLNRARELLREESVTGVSFDLGYENISHFIRLFRNKFGITPKQYQMRQYSHGPACFKEN